MSKSAGSEIEEDSVIGPVLSIVGVVVICTIAGLTAGLPIVLPSNQNYVDPASLDRGDTAWLMISTVFGLFISPALGYFYSCQCNITTTKLVQLVMLTSALITLVWITFSYSLCYGHDVGRFLSNPATFYMFKDTYGNPATATSAPTVPSSIAAMYELGFALTAATIVACSVVGRVRWVGFLFFILIWHIAVYCPFAHMMWTNQGWFHHYHVEDYSGGLVVHMLSGLTACCAQYFIGKGEIKQIHPVLDADALLRATCVVWFLWFGFSAGKAHGAAPEAAQSILNMFVSTMTAVVLSFFYELIYERNVTPVSVSNAMLLGLVGITPAAGYVTVGGAMCISIFTYLVTVATANMVYYEGTSVNAPLSIPTIHGLGGTAGFLGTAVLSYKFINPEALNGATWGNGEPILYHFILTCLFFICVTIVVFVVLFVCDLIVPLRLTNVQEAEYPAFSLVTENTEANAPPIVTGSTPRHVSSKSLRSSRSSDLGRSNRMDYNRSLRSGLGGAQSTSALSLRAQSMDSQNNNSRSTKLREMELSQSSQIS